MRRSFAVPGVSFALSCLLLAGCGSKTATVVGQVTFHGKPVTGGSVVLYCPDKQIVRGLIGVDGRYSIPNVPLGSTIVTVQSHAKVPEGFRLKQPLPASNGGPVSPVAISSEGQKVALPARYSLPEESGLSVTVNRDLVTYDIHLKP